MKKILILITAVLASFIPLKENQKTYHVCCDATICELCTNHEHDNHDKSFKYVYENHCWRCKAYISSAQNKKCSKCGWYICNNCGACESTCPRCPKWSSGSGKTSKSSDNSWIWILVIGGVVVGIVIYIKKRQ